MESNATPAASAATIREYAKKMRFQACLQRGLRPVMALNEADFQAVETAKEACALTICGRNGAEMSANIREAAPGLKGKYTHILLNFICKEQPGIAQLHEWLQPFEGMQLAFGCCTGPASGTHCRAELIACRRVGAVAAERKGREGGGQWQGAEEVGRGWNVARREPPRRRTKNGAAVSFLDFRAERGRE